MDAFCANAKYSEVNKCIFDFLGTIQFIYSFIEGSPIRHAVFEWFAKLDGAKIQTLKSMSQTRWACRAEAVNVVKNNYKALLSTLKEINSKCLIPEARAKGRGLLHQLKTFEFIMFIWVLMYESAWESYYSPKCEREQWTYKLAENTVAPLWQKCDFPYFTKLPYKMKNFSR